LIDDDDCQMCGRGSVFSDALFSEGDRLIHWTMWSCGHSARRVHDQRVPVWSRDLKRHAPLTSGR